MTESVCSCRFPSQPKKGSFLGASPRRRSVRLPARRLEPAISGLAPSIVRNFLRVRARRSMGSIGGLRPLVWQRSVAQERVEFAENFYQITGKRSPRRSGGGHFAPYNPRPNPVPAPGSGWAAGVLCPPSFFRG